MRAPDLALLYLLVGVGAATAVVVRGRARATQRGLDAALVLAFWPLYGPLLLMAPGAAAVGPIVRLAADGMEALALRIEAAERKLAEIDALLARPELDAQAARARAAELSAKGDEVGERLALNRLLSIQRVEAVRARFAAELDQVRELTLQLRVHGELVKLAGDGDGGNRELLAELSIKVECLDEIVKSGLDAPAI